MVSKTKPAKRVQPIKVMASKGGIVFEIRTLIETARSRTASAVNVELTMLYWRIGERVHRETLKGKRAEYGATILPKLSQQLTRDYGDGFSRFNLARMVQFAVAFPEEPIVATLSQQLGWSHFVEIFPVRESLAREYYAEMCRVERWSVRTLRDKIASMLFERTALSRKPQKVIGKEIAGLRNQGRLTPDMVFRDPYVLDFLRLKNAYQEKDLEAAILRELESFILEMGTGFTFVARQKRVIVGGDDFYLDLLFYHRDLRRLVAVELKLDRFRPEHKGQMELYLRWLEKNERKPWEEAPIGLILCAGKSEEQVALLEMGRSGIRVAEYLTQLPPRKMLENRLHMAIEHARRGHLGKQPAHLKSKKKK